MNTTMAAVTDRIFNSGADLLGVIVWHSMRDIRIEPGELERLGKKFGCTDMPKLPHPNDAFRRATTPSARSVKGERKRYRYLVRPVADNESEIIRHVIQERVVGQRSLDHEKVAEITFNKSTCYLDIIRHGSCIDAAVLNSLLDEMEADFHAFSASITGRDMTRWIMSQLREMSNISVHPNGGVYFVPAGHTATLRSLQSFVIALNPYAVATDGEHVFYTVGVPDVKEQRDAIGSFASSSIASELTATMASIAETLSNKGNTRPTTIQNRIAEVAMIRRKVDEYKSIVESSMGGMDDQMELLNKQQQALMDALRTPRRRLRRTR